MAELALLQEIDNCARCRGCQVACQRNLGLTDSTGYSAAQEMSDLVASGTAERVESDDLVAVKAQRANENPPYVRYACWHCGDPPCVPRCPFKAIYKVTGSTGGSVEGAVMIKRYPTSASDPYYCRPLECARQCVNDCGRGGYPKVGYGTQWDVSNGVQKAYKCILCNGRLVWGSRTTNSSGALEAPAAGRVPACVATCPMGALRFGEKSVILAYISANYTSVGGKVISADGSSYWASKKFEVAAPTADPYIEDHISPMFTRLLGSPVGKALVAPTLVAAGLYALYQRRLANDAR